MADARSTGGKGAHPRIGRVLAVLFVSALIGVAVLESLSLDRARARKVEDAAKLRAAEASRRLLDAWSAQNEALSLLVHGASTNPLLLAAVRGHVDERTFADIFAFEDWWTPYRGASAAFSYDGKTLTYAQDAEGAAEALRTIGAEVRAGREPAVRVVMSKGGALRVAAAPVTADRREPPAVLMMSKRIDQRVADALAARAGVPLLLEDAGGEVGAAGDPEQIPRLRAAVRTAHGIALGRQAAVCCAVPASLAPGLQMWAFAYAPDFARDLATIDLFKKSTMAGGVLFLGAVAFGLTARRRREADSGAVPAQAVIDADSSVAWPVAGQTPGLGILLGRYTLLERIGEGGMAEIFAAVLFGSGGFRRFLVIKRLRKELESNRDAVAHFIDEANLVSTLIHPNIVPVFDFGHVEGSYYLAEEYILGRDLGRLCRKMYERSEAPLSPAAILFMAHEILSALEYAHAKTDDEGTPLEIVHRDVTPGNVLVSANGDVRLLDFGIVRTARTRTSQTQIGQINGNVEYMAPEQASAQAVDARTDLFAVGLVMYYAATGEPLYRGETILDLLNQAAAGPGRRERQLIAALPEPVRDILDQALAVDPRDRYQSAAEFREAVSAVAHLDAGRAELVAAMNSTFSRELQREHDRLVKACPRPRIGKGPALETGDTAPPTGGPTGPQSHAVR